MFRLSIAALALLASQFVFAQGTKTEADRLAATGKLWVTVKYFHPYLAYRDIDWDKALVDALPQIRAAQNSGEYSSAIQSMLEALHDPATYVIGARAAGAGPLGAPGGQRVWVHHGLAAAGATSDLYYSAFQVKPGSTETVTLPLSENVEAVVRLSEPVPVDASVPAYPSPKPDRTYAETPYPSAEYRILAAYKIWGVFHYFFAYRDLMDEDWDDVFATFLPKFIAAKDAREYNLTVADMITHVDDSCATVQSRTLDEYFGEAPVGLRVRLIERKPVITQILDDNATKAGVQVGDIVSDVDDENIVERVKREAQYMATSTQQSLSDQVMQRILNGAEGSVAAVSIGGQDGRTREVSLKRSTSYLTNLQKQRTGDAIKAMPGNIGYVDLDRLTSEEVDALFEKLRNTKALIFDARGSANFAAVSTIAPRLTDQQDVPAAIFTGPLTISPDIPQGNVANQSATYFYVQTLRHTDKWRYKGKIVMLIDGRTSGVAEHAGLLFESASNIEFIGSPSAGAEGDATNFTVPGGITIHFSGHDIRHANGGKLQRLGLQPAVSVPTTVKGIRSGHDEALETAIQHLSQ